ncbi:MAG: hypothetical protein ACJ739_02410 [Acidimicrobiales bacterium]
MRRRALSVVVLLGALLTTVGPHASARSGVCDRFGPMAKAGTVADGRLVELSGVAASRRHAGVLWAHNDSGGAAEVYALGLDGRALGAYPINGASATDWEDIAVGPGPGGGSYLFVGDIGDNGTERSSVTVYRVAEPATKPAAPGAPLPGAAAIQLTYPTGPADAEALLVDPRTGDLIIVTKVWSGNGRIFVAPAKDLQPGGTVMMSDAGAVPGGTLVTGGDISPDGSTVALRTYGSVLLFARGSGSVATALRGKACSGPQAAERQGEAVAFARDGASIFTISEGDHPPVHRSGAPAATTATTSRSTATTSGSSGGRGRSTSTTTASTTTTVDPSTTTTSSTTTTALASDSPDDDEDAAPTGQDPASSDDGGLSPLLLLIPIAAVAGAMAFALRRRGSGSG